MAEHTKGPWYNEDQVIHDSNDMLITHVDGGSFRSVGEDCANAKLMAAAPELLDSLQGLTRIVEAFRLSQSLGKTQLERLEAAKAAIAKAKGT